MTTDKDSIVVRLREPCRDYSGEMIVRDSTPRDEIHCGLLYDAADLIERQSEVIEEMGRFLSESFPTCVADSGQYYVKVSYLTLKEAQAAYGTLGGIARTLTGDTK